MARVFLNHVVKKYGRETAVEDLTLEVRDGEFVALFGPPGAGKTSILKMVAGLEDVTSGEIWIGDKIVNDLSPAERDVAMVFQSFALYPTMTVFENLAFPLRKRKVPPNEIEKRVKEIASILNISHLLDKKPGTLSGGERQRVALGRAMVRRPQLFLFDEPLTNLDAKLRLHMRAELKKLQREMGQTAIFSTPDDVEAISMADRIAVLSKGRLIQYDTVDNIYERPCNLYVAQNIGSPQINIVEGTLVVEGGNFLLDLGFTRVNLNFLSDILKGFEGKSLILGVRPFDINPSTRKTDDTPFRGKVEVVEDTGAEVYASVVVDSTTFTVYIPRDIRLDVGEEIWLSLNTKRIHLFDKSSGKALP